jgi:drug/metabolite transporter (DMT)-like permease
MREQLIYLIFLIVISVVNSAGQVIMRWGGNQSTTTLSPATTHQQWLWASRWWLLGMVVTWICGLGWAWCLRRLPLVVALPIYSGLVYVLSLVGGASLLKERISPTQALGIAFVLVGIFLVSGQWSVVSGQPNNVQLSADH